MADIRLAQPLAHGTGTFAWRTSGPSLPTTKLTATTTSTIQQRPKKHTHHHRVHSAGSRVVSLTKKTRIKCLTTSESPHDERPETHDDADEEDDDIMAASFLQFCPICDKQQAAPSVASLYCSESCRAKDTASSHSSTSDSSTPSNSLPFNPRRSSSSYSPKNMTLPNFDAMTTRVVPEQPPSTLASLDVKGRPSLFSNRSSSAGTDVSSTSSRRRKVSSDDMRATAAMTFLAQFHNSPASMVRTLSQRRQRSASTADSVRRRPEREPSLALSNGTTPTESEGPSSPGSLFPRMANGSEGSLQSLDPLIQSPSAPEISDEALEMDIQKPASRGRTMSRAAAVAREGAATESLQKMLAGA